MKAIALLLILSVAAFGKMTEQQEAELRHILSVIKAASVELSAKLESAEAKASDAVLQLGFATDALALAGAETQNVQNQLDDARALAMKLSADVTKQARAKWFWLFATLACVAWITKGLWLKFL